MSSDLKLNKEDWANSKVFVTGGTGLLGSHLVKTLVDNGAYVVCLVRDGVPRSLFYDHSPEWSLNSKVVTIRGKVEDYELLERVLNEYEIDTVFHLAAQTIVGTANRAPIQTFKTNIEGTWNLLEACRIHSKTIKRVVIASSDKAYGNLEGNAYDETFPLNGQHPYDVSKSCTDLLSKTYHVSYDLPVCVTRCGNFFGPGDLNFNRIVPGTIESVYKGKNPIIRSDGKFIRDYIYVLDGVHAYLKLAEGMINPQLSNNVVGEAFNFSYGIKLNVIEIVEKILSQAKTKNLKPEILNQASNEIPIQLLDSAKAKHILDWTPPFGFDKGLEVTVKWYFDHLKSWIK